MAGEEPLLRPTVPKVVVGVLLGACLLVTLAFMTSLPFLGLALPALAAAYATSAFLLRAWRATSGQGLFGPTTGRLLLTLGLALLLLVIPTFLPDLPRPRSGSGWMPSSRFPLVFTLLIDYPLHTGVLLLTVSYTAACGLLGLRHAARRPEPERGPLRHLAGLTLGLDVLVLGLLALAYLRARGGSA
jgi:hypothetical protein